ncbi:MAG: hypothetical protein AAF545_03235 [Pseudomonadota bacterium]
MIRFMGFATGAAVAVGFMLFLFGAPQAPEAELEVRAEVDVDPAPEPAPTALPEVVAEATETEPATAGPEDASLATPAEPAVVAAPEPVAAVTAEAAIEAPAADGAQDLEATNEPETRIAVADDAPPRDLQWHAFWSPFRSRIAANGFVSRLESVTGFDYRVVQVDTGVYEVAVGYASDDERRNKLAAIAEATGLTMPDS